MPEIGFGKFGITYKNPTLISRLYCEITDQKLKIVNDLFGLNCSVMASSLLRSITDFLESGMDEEINNLYDSTLGDSCEDLDMSQHRNSRSVELR